MRPASHIFHPKDSLPTIYGGRCKFWTVIRNLDTVLSNAVCTTTAGWQGGGFAFDTHTHTMIAYGDRRLSDSATRKSICLLCRPPTNKNLQLIIHIQCSPLPPPPPAERHQSKLGNLSATPATSVSHRIHHATCRMEMCACGAVRSVFAVNIMMNSVGGCPPLSGACILNESGHNFIFSPSFAHGSAHASVRIQPKRLPSPVPPCPPTLLHKCIHLTEGHKHTLAHTRPTSMYSIQILRAINL